MKPQSSLSLRGHGAAEVKVTDLIFSSSLFLSILLIFVSHSLECVKQKGTLFSLKGVWSPVLPSQLKYKMIDLAKQKDCPVSETANIHNKVEAGAWTLKNKWVIWVFGLKNKQTNKKMG